jgi:hypothetical protein
LVLKCDLIMQCIILVCSNNVIWACVVDLFWVLICDPDM